MVRYIRPAIFLLTWPLHAIVTLLHLYPFRRRERGMSMFTSSSSRLLLKLHLIHLCHPRLLATLSRIKSCNLFGQMNPTQQPLSKKTQPNIRKKQALLQSHHYQRTALLYQCLVILSLLARLIAGISRNLLYKQTPILSKIMFLKSYLGSSGPTAFQH